MIDPINSLLFPISWLEVSGRLLLAATLGGIIGWDRELKRKPAGLRTNILVSLGAALIIVGTLQSGISQKDANIIGRSIQGIITGVGFIGAGVIFQQNQAVHGLTTASAIWISCALGIVSGLGLWQLGLMGVGLTIITLRVIKSLEKDQS